MGALDVHRALLDAAVAHEVVRLRRPVLSADDLPGALDLPATSCLAVRCYVADGRDVAVLMHAGEVPDPVALLDALGARSVRAATPAEVNAATDCAAGLVTPVGLPAAVVVLADAALVEPAGTAVVYAPAAEGGVALGVRLDDLLRQARARVVPLSARPRPALGGTAWSGVLDLDAVELSPPPVHPEVVELRARRPPA